MNPIIPTLILSTLLLSCQNATKDVRNAKQEDIRRTEIALNKKMRVQIDAVAKNSSYVLRICKGMEKINMDTIETKYRKQDLDFADWNFDGYQDLFVFDRDASGTGGNVYYVWLFDPVTHQFKNWVGVSGRMGVLLDKKLKRIRVNYREGSYLETKNEFKVVENKLVFVKGTQQTSWNDAKGRNWIKREFVNVVNGMTKIHVDSFLRDSGL